MKKFLMVSLFLMVTLPASFLLAAVPERTEPVPANNLTSPSNSQNSEISRREASDLARKKYDGRVLSIRLSDDRWRVRMDSDGTVFNVFVNAKSGSVSRSSE